jgi:hypothetical protein
MGQLLKESRWKGAPVPAIPVRRLSDALYRFKRGFGASGARFLEKFKVARTFQA